MSIKKHLEEFAADTSMHGLGKIILTKQPRRRAAWVIVFVSAWAFFSYEICSVISSYLEYGVKTTSEFLPDGAPFPAITLCNMQSLDFYTLHFLYTSAANHYHSGQNTSFAEYLRSVGREKTLAYEIAKLDDLITQRFTNNEKVSEDQRYTLYSRTTIAANLKKDILREALVEKEFVVGCTFGNSKCYFKAIDHPYYYRCYTFEPSPDMLEGMSSKKFEPLKEGIKNGFSATFFTGTRLLNATGFEDILIPGIFEKGSPLSGSAGIRMAIHPPGTDPFPLTEGYNVPPGHLASIEVVPLMHKRLGLPYGRCATENKYRKHHYLETLESVNNKPYRKISCERACVQEHVIKECQCYDPLLPNTGDAYCDNERCYDINTVHLGNDDNVSSTLSLLSSCRSLRYLDEGSDSKTGIELLLAKIRCAENTNGRVMAACECHHPCDEHQYMAFYSLSLWPSMGYESGFVYRDIFTVSGFRERFSPTEKRSVYDEYVKKLGQEALRDFVKINVYVGDSNVLQATEQPAISFTEMLSNVGGQLGLWIGVSVITICEVVEVVEMIVFETCRKLCRRGVDGDGDGAGTDAEKANNSDSPASAEDSIQPV